MTALINTILGAIGGAIFTYCVTSLKKAKAKDAVIKSMAHNALFYECKRLLEKGSISTDEMENLTYLWEGYHGMGLNGTGETLYTKCINLPLED